MLNNSKDKQLSAWRLYLASHTHLTTHLDSHLKASGLISFDTLIILTALIESPNNRLRMSELAANITFSRSGLSRKVDRLERAGLIRREPAPNDRRGWYAVATDEGIEARAKALSVYEPELENVWRSVLSEEESAQLSALLSEVIKRATG